MVDYKKEVLKYYLDARATKAGDIDEYTYIDFYQSCCTMCFDTESEAWETAYTHVKPLKQTCILKEELKEWMGERSKGTLEELLRKGDFREDLKKQFNLE